MAIIVFHYSTIYRYLSRAFQCRFASVLRGLTYYFRFGICRGLTRNRIPIYPAAWKLNNVGYPAISVRGDGNIPSTDARSAKTTCSANPNQPLAHSFSDRNKKGIERSSAWRWIGRHNRGMQRKRTESAEWQQRYSETTHSVGFASTRIIDFNQM